MGKVAQKSLIICLFLVLAVPVYAHPGNTDSNGCHTCKTNCTEKWGIPYGFYHRHNPVRACFEESLPTQTPTIVVVTQKPVVPVVVQPTVTPTKIPSATPTPTVAPTVTPTNTPVPTISPQPSETAEPAAELTSVTVSAEDSQNATISDLPWYILLWRTTPIGGFLTVFFGLNAKN